MYIKGDFPAVSKDNLTLSQDAGTNHSMTAVKLRKKYTYFHNGGMHCVFIYRNNRDLPLLSNHNMTPYCIKETFH